MNETAHPEAGREDRASRTPLPSRSGMAAVVGRTNVGKSTLVNRLLGEKVSIVSPGVQTTRSVIRGILTEARAQICFLDTPGVHRPRGRLGQSMNSAAYAAVEGTDAAVLVMDRSDPPSPEDLQWMRRLAGMEIPCALVLNKCDLCADASGAYRRSWAQACANRSRQRDRWFAVSAETGQGLPALLDFLAGCMPEGALLFDPELLSDFPRKLFMADVVREKLLRHLYGEIPHAIAVWIERVDEIRDGSWQAVGRIYVQKASQQGIVIGRKGRILQRARRAAERELSAVYDRTVSLELRVKAAANWDRNHWILRQLGYAE